MTITPGTIAKLRADIANARPFVGHGFVRPPCVGVWADTMAALLDAAERLAEVTAERDALAASVARVRELHAPSPYADAYLRTVSPSLPAEVCGSCWMHLDSAVPYPCPTIRALDGSGS